MIYDCFTFFNELDMLEIRLNILDPHVDFFVICESTETFSGKKKPLYFLENEARFTKWLPKILHIVTQGRGSEDAFQNAAFQKDLIRSYLSRKWNAKDNDIVYFGDVDEIWNPELKPPFGMFGEADQVWYNLRQLNYAYYLNNRSSEEWIGTFVGLWRVVKHFSFNKMRADHTHVLDNGGWHFTNMGGAEQIRKKLEAYDHQEYNTDDVKEKIEERMANGQDYVGRGRDWRGVPFEMRMDESDWPMYLIENRAKYEHLLKT